MRTYKTLLVIAILSTLVACSDYSLTINERLVYDPPHIFTDFRLPDLELQHCADASIAEGKITAPDQLNSLLCPEKNIASLEGIEIFTQLKRLGLEVNQLNNLQPLATLVNLEQVNLAGNDITDILALHSLTRLHYLNLSQNPHLDCQQLSGLKIVEGGELLLPEHCKSQP